MDRIGAEDTLGNRPGWISDHLVAFTRRVCSPRSSAPLTEDDAVKVLVTVSQLLETTGLLKLDIHGELEEEVLGTGSCEHQRTRT